MESLMLDTCRVTASGAGGSTFSEDTGQYTEPEPDTVYEGKCRVQVTGASVGEAAAGEHAWTSLTMTLQAPIVGTEDVRARHQVEILAAVHDPSLVGRKFLLTAISHKSDATCRRWQIVEVLS